MGLGKEGVWPNAESGTKHRVYKQRLNIRGGVVLDLVERAESGVRQHRSGDANKAVDLDISNGIDQLNVGAVILLH